MKLRPFILGMFVGTLLTAATCMVKIWSNNEQWKLEAYKHYAGVYTMNYHTGKSGWMWFDDYARSVLLPEAKKKAHQETRKHAPPTTPRPDCLKL